MVGPFEHRVRYLALRVNAGNSMMESREELIEIGRMLDLANDQIKGLHEQIDRTVKEKDV
jgi:hypothetical protein